jgi:hypothetical protein
MIISIFALFSCAPTNTVTVTGTRVNEAGEVIITYSDGTEANIGIVGAGNSTNYTINTGDGGIAHAASRGIASAVSVSAKFKINAYGGFFFYSEHLIGVMSEIFGYGVKSVKAFKNDGKLTVIFRYPTFDVTGLYVDMNFTCYSACRVSEHHVRSSEYPIKEESPCFKIEFDEFYELMNGAPQAKTYAEFIAPVFVMNAVQKSLESGKEVPVNEYEI